MEECFDSVKNIDRVIRFHYLLEKPKLKRKRIFIGSIDVPIKLESQKKQLRNGLILFP